MSTMASSNSTAAAGKQVRQASVPVTDARTSSSSTRKMSDPYKKSAQKSAKKR